MGMNMKNLAAAFAFSAVMSAGGAGAATFAIVDSSVQGPGNDANIYAAAYGANKPSGWAWSSDPTVTPPPGNVSGVYQTPFNNTPLQETRSYFSVGAENGANGAPSPVTLTFGGGVIDTFKILWGSIDNYNTLEFFDAASNLILAITGQDVIDEGHLGGSASNFEQVALLNITGLGAAAYATFTSTQAAFEFALVPLPGALPLFGAALGGLLLLRKRRNRVSASPMFA